MSGCVGKARTGPAYLQGSREGRGVTCGPGGGVNGGGRAREEWVVLVVQKEEEIK